MKNLIITLHEFIASIYDDMRYRLMYNLKHYVYWVWNVDVLQSILQTLLKQLSTCILQ